MILEIIKVLDYDLYKELDDEENEAEYLIDQAVVAAEPHIDAIIRRTLYGNMGG